MKKIIINSCEECPFKGQGGDFGEIAYIPHCKKSKHKDLPYTEYSSGGVVTASGTDEIPEWCPLEDAS